MATGYSLINTVQVIKMTASDTLFFEYDRSGQKLKKSFSRAGQKYDTYYVDGIQYTWEPGQSAPVLSFIQTEEGRLRNNDGTYSYEYDLKDHLGNVRMTVMAGDPAGSCRRIITIHLVCG